METRRPTYARVLRLHRLRPGAVLCFMYFEGTVVVCVLLALAELVPWWGVVVIPVAVATMVKINDVVAAVGRAPGRGSRRASPERGPGRAGAHERRRSRSRSGRDVRRRDGFRRVSGGDVATRSHGALAQAAAAPTGTAGADLADADTLTFARPPSGGPAGTGGPGGVGGVPGGVGGSGGADRPDGVGGSGGNAVGYPTPGGGRANDRPVSRQRSRQSASRWYD